MVRASSPWVFLDEAKIHTKPGGGHRQANNSLTIGYIKALRDRVNAEFLAAQPWALQYSSRVRTSIVGARIVFLPRAPSRQVTVNGSDLMSKTTHEQWAPFCQRPVLFAHSLRLCCNSSRIGAFQTGSVRAGEESIYLTFEETRTSLRIARFAGYDPIPPRCF